MVLNNLHRRIVDRTGSLQSSTTLWVVMGGSPSLCSAYRQRLTLTISSFNSSSDDEGNRPLWTNKNSFQFVHLFVCTSLLTSGTCRTCVYRFLVAPYWWYHEAAWSQHGREEIPHWNYLFWLGRLGKRLRSRPAVETGIEKFRLKFPKTLRSEAETIPCTLRWWFNLANDSMNTSAPLLPNSYLPAMNKYKVLSRSKSKWP